MPHIQMLQALQPCQRREVVGIGIEQFQIFQVFTVGQGSQVAQRVHGDNQYFQVRHVAHKREIGDGLVVTEIQIFELGEVFEQLVISVFHTAVRCKDSGFIGSGSILAAEIDAPDNFGIGQRIAYRGHILICNSTAVHQQGFQVWHALCDRENLRPVLPNRTIADVHFFIFQRERKFKDGEAVIEFDTGNSFPQGKNLFPGGSVFPLVTAQSDYFQSPQGGDFIQGGHDFVRRNSRQIQLCFL